MLFAYENFNVDEYSNRLNRNGIYDVRATHSNGPFSTKHMKTKQQQQQQKHTEKTSMKKKKSVKWLFCWRVGAHARVPQSANMNDGK